MITNVYQRRARATVKRSPLSGRLVALTERVCTDPERPERGHFWLRGENLETFGVTS